MGKTPGVTVEAAGGIGPDLSARDTVLLWDGENPPRWAPWVVADVGQVEFSFTSTAAEKRRVAVLLQHGYRSVFDQRGYIVLHRVPGGGPRRAVPGGRPMTGGTAITGRCPAPGPARGPGGGRPAGASPAAGRLLGRLSVLPALLVMAWLLAGLPLLLLGRFTPPLMLAVSVPLAVVLLVVGLRAIPGRWPAVRPDASPGQQGAPGQEGAPWWAVAGVVTVALGLGAEQLIYHSEQVIVLRDPASYMQFAAWIARHGSLPIPQYRAAFGGPHLLTFASPAFYHVGGSIVPQFMAGLPMALAAAFWAGGVSAAVLVAPVLGAAAVLTFGGLAARLAGPRWAPLAALALAITLPEQYTSRASFSEPLAQILFLGGLCLVIDSLTAGGATARVCAGLGGLALSLTILVRIDGISDILPVVPYAGLLLIRRRPQAAALVCGLGLGALAGLADGVLLSRPYLAHNKSSVLPLAVLAGLVTLLTAAAVPLLRRRRLPAPDWSGRRGRWWLGLAAALPFAVPVALAVRPYVHRVPVVPGRQLSHRAITFHHYLQYSPPEAVNPLDFEVWMLEVARDRHRPAPGAGHGRCGRRRVPRADCASAAGR